MPLLSGFGTGFASWRTQTSPLAFSQCSRSPVKMFEAVSNIEGQNAALQDGFMFAYNSLLFLGNQAHFLFRERLKLHHG